MIGQDFGRYHIESKLGEGGMSVVWKAADPRLGRTVALKILSERLADYPEARRRFEREARLASMLQHPNIATVFDAGEQDGKLFIVTAFVDGENLAELLTRGPLPIPEALQIGASVADALSHAHGRGILHRDLSSRNVMLDLARKPVLIDFGLAFLQDTTRITSSGTTLGTIPYLPPEVIEGTPGDARSDLYSLGVVLYEVLTGSLPFGGDRQVAVVHSILNDSPVPASHRRPGITPRMEQMLERALSKDPQSRFQTSDELRAEVVLCIEELARGESSQPVDQEGGTSPDEALPRRLPFGHRTAAEGAGSLPGSPCVVVLPFAGADVEGEGTERAEAFARGMAVSVAAAMARIPRVRVIPFSPGQSPSAFMADLAGSARRAGANLILTGDVRRSGNQVRVSYSLLEPGTGRQIAGEAIDGNIAEIFRLEDQIIVSVAQSLDCVPPPGSLQGSSLTAAGHERYLQALGYMSRSDNEAAVDGSLSILESLAHSNINSAAVQAAMGRAYVHKFCHTFDTEWLHRAENACARAVRMDPSSVTTHLLQGRLRLQLGKYAEAVNSLKTALELDPDSSDTRIYLSLAYEALGRNSEAEAVCRSAIARRPDDWRSGYNRLGVLLFRRGAFRESIEMWQALIARAPDNPRGHVNLGAAWFHLGKFSEARAAYQRAMAIVPNAPASAGLGTLSYFEGDYAAAAAQFERAIALRPHDPRYWAYLADAQRWIPGKESESRSAFDRALELEREQLRLNPQDGDAWARLGSWLAKRGGLQEALAAVERALSLNPRSVLCAALAGVTCYLAGEEARALDLLREAIRRGYAALALTDDPWLKDLWKNDKARQILNEFGPSTKPDPLHGG